MPTREHVATVTVREEPVPHAQGRGVWSGQPAPHCSSDAVSTELAVPGLPRPPPRLPGRPPSPGGLLRSLLLPPILHPTRSPSPSNGKIMSRFIGFFTIYFPQNTDH